MNPSSKADNFKPDPHLSPIANRDVRLLAKKVYDQHLTISPEDADRFIEDFIRSQGIE